MKGKVFALIVIMSLLLMPLAAASAQTTGGPGEQPPRREGAPTYPPDPGPDVERPERPYPGRPVIPPGDLVGPEAPQVATGKPGLTFSHVKSFGEAETAYFEDTTHFIYPYGVYASGTTVWVSDTRGKRALKFNSSGVYQNLTIGKAGFREQYKDNQISLEAIYDVGVDSSGNVWLVDGDARYVAVFNSAGKFQFTVGEPWGEDFWGPRGIAFDSSGNAYISDSYNDRIQIYTNTGSYLATLGSYGSGQFNFDQPWHIDIYNNRLFVADCYNHRIQVYNVANPLAITYVGTIGTGSAGSGNGQFRQPRGVAVTSTRIYVADTNNNRVQVFNNTSGFGYNTQFGSGGDSHGQFWGPMDVAVDGAGNIYVADCNNFRIEQFNSSRKYVRSYGTTGVPYLTDLYHYFRPEGVAVDASGSIYLSESQGRRIVKLNWDGAPLWSVGSEPGVYGDDNNHFGYPLGIAVSPDGRVFVADARNDRIQVFESSGGGYLTTLGEHGSAPGQFAYPMGVAVDKNNNLYVADEGNCRIQVFNSSLNYVKGVGSCGTGTSQFSSINDIAVDSTGRIYVVDTDNHRVTYFDSNLNYQGMIGQTGSCSDRYDRLCNPESIAVDAKDQVYIADRWGNSVKVYDRDGKFLDIIKNGWGSFQGVFYQVRGMAVDAAGNLYLADEIGHQIKKYYPAAYPGWRQVNVAGFGEAYNSNTWSMTEFGGTLFASSGIGEDGATLYYFDQGDWTQVMSGGFGDASNYNIDSFETFNGKLYAGTWNETDAGTAGGQVWRTATPLAGGWEKVVDAGFNDPTNGEVMTLKAFNGYLYAGTWSYDLNDHGAEIFRSDTGNLGDWEKVFSDATPGHHKSVSILVMEVFNGYLYAGTYNYIDTGGAELWRTSNGTTWEQVGMDGFGDANNYMIPAMIEFNGKLYAGVGNYDPSLGYSPGAQVWRSENGSGWNKVADGGFGDLDNHRVNGLVVYRDQIYAITYQYHYANVRETKGMEVWRSSSGNLNSWERVAAHAFGKEHNSVRPSGYDSANLVYDDQLFIGTYGYSLSGARIWAYMPNWLYVPIVKR